jgi:dTDP-4-dehydrorhamnose 3,5-epimerase
MRFHPLSVDGAFVVELEPIPDERGFFARTWSASELQSRGLDSDLVQVSISYNERAGTIRGMHYQVAPHEETKVVRCTSGAIFDVVIDLRPGSPTFKRSDSVDLTAKNRKALYIPKGCAHGFQTIEDGTEVLYQISAEYASEAARGVRWNDPAFGIVWPLELTRISKRDEAFPDFAG